MAVEPVFLLRRDLPANDSLKYDTLEICLAAEKVSGKSERDGNDTWGPGNTRTVACVSSHQNHQKQAADREPHSQAENSAGVQQKPFHREMW